MDIAALDLLTILGATVTFAIVTLLIILLYDFFRSGKKRQEPMKLSGEEFFGAMNSVSSDVEYISSGIFLTSFQLAFRKIGSGEFLASAQGEAKVFAKLHRLLGMKDIGGSFTVRLSGNKEAIRAKIVKGEITVRLGRDEIGRISFYEHAFFDSKGAKIGEFERSGIKITGADILWLPFFGRNRNFAMRQKASFSGGPACTITFRKWPDAEQPLFEGLDAKLPKEQLVMLLALAAAEWSLSLNLRE